MSDRAIIVLAIVLVFFLQPTPSQAVDLPASGQTACYDTGGDIIPCDGTGQDGDTLSGAPWPEPRFVDNEDGTFTDQLTGLIWLTDGNCAATVEYDPGGAGIGLLTWTQAFEYVGLVNTNELPVCGQGFSDWRLPNVVELESLVHGQGDTTDWLESQGFSNVTGGGYWTSTTEPRITSNSFFVAFSTGAVTGAGKTGTVAAVWLARGGPIDGLENPVYPANPHATGQTACWDENGSDIECADSGQDGELQVGVAWPNPRFTSNGDGTVTDELTGLQWLRDANCIASAYPGMSNDDGGVVWQTALDFVAGINDGTYPDCAAGKSDWQLPNRKQLLSLMDFSQSDPSLPMGHPFLNPPNAHLPSGYWTSTTYPTNTAWAWHLYHRAGHVGGAPKATYAWLVWPVRNANTPPPSSVDFPDEALESAIRDALDLPAGDITPEDLATLTVLELNNLNIIDLTGLEYCSGLETLILSNNQIIDLSPLSGLTNLTYLNLYDNQIVDISDLGSLVGLEYVSLGKNQISAIEPLATLVNLISLYLDENQISDITALAALYQLVDLGLSNNGISDLGALLLNSGLGAGDRMWIEGNSLDMRVGSLDIDHIWTLEAKGITVSHDPIVFNDTAFGSAVSRQLDKPLDEITREDLQTMRVLVAENSGIVDLSGIEQMQSLEALYLKDNQVSDLTPLSNLTNLQIVNLENNNVSDLSPLVGITTLSQLRLDNNPISDLTPLVNNPGLDSGDLVWLHDLTAAIGPDTPAAGQIWTLRGRGVIVFHDPISGLFADENLEAAVATALEVSPSELHAAPWLLSDLAVLQADDAEIVNISGIEACVNLTYLRLRGNQITDISPVMLLPALDHLDLLGNQIIDISPFWQGHRPRTSINLGWNKITDIWALNSFVGRDQGIYLQGNPLDLWIGSSEVETIYALYLRGATVIHDPFYFLDPALEAAVLYRLYTEDPPAISVYTLDEMADRRSFDCSNQSIFDLTGIAYFSSLNDLIADHNQIDDLTPLADMRLLKTIDLSYNRIADLTPLSDFPYLEDLDISNNLILDLGPLWNKQSLQTINFDNNHVVSLEPLIGLDNLGSIIGDRNQVSILGPLADNLNLTRVYLRQNSSLDLSIGSDTVNQLLILYRRGVHVLIDGLRFRDPALDAAVRQVLGLVEEDTLLLSHLDDLLSITSLTIANSELADPFGLAYAFPYLEVLDLQGNHLSDTSFLEHLPHLRNVVLSNNHIMDISALVANAGLATDDRLWLDGNLLPLWQGSETLQMIEELRDRGVIVHHDQISSRVFVDPILEADVRESLGIDANAVITESMLASMQILYSPRGVTDLDGIQYCSNLELLQLYECEVNNLTPLRYLSKLETLTLRDSTISNIDVLADMPWLNKLYMEGSPIISLAPLVQLTDLSELAIAGQHLNDFSPLADMANLTYLGCYDSAIADLTVISHMTKLTQLYLANSDQLQDISPLANLSALEKLDLRGSQVADLVPLSQLPSLNWIYLADTLVNDIAPLVENLDFADGASLWVHNTALIMSALLDDVQNILTLQARGVMVYNDPIEDGDGLDESEEHGPNGNDDNYDGNGDGIPDGAQINVASLNTFDDDHYVTLEVNQQAWLANVSATENPSPENMPPEVEAPLGFFSFTIVNVPNNGAATARLFLEEGTTISSYWKYGPTPDNGNDHWYEFMYDGQTGAEINGNVITLHFVNGQRGDALLLNSNILDPGAPVVSTVPSSNNSGGGGSSGCFINTIY